MTTIVKICGLSTEGTIDAALAAGTNMIGLNFFAKSPRFVSLERAHALALRARGRCEIVALAVDMDDDGLSGIVDAVAPDWLQLHGNESVERVAAVRRLFGRRVMKAVGVRTAADITAAAAFADVADRLLLDAKPPKGAVLPGGNGVSFDWGLLDALDPALPYMLSGGLDPDNVTEALARTGAAGVDVSSGVETSPGVKDPDRIRAFIAAVRGQHDQGRIAAGRRIAS